MRRLAWVLLLSVALVSGCSGRPYTPDAAPERPILTATPEQGVSHIAIIGDLFTSGSGFDGLGANGWPSIVAEMLRVQGVDIITRVAAKAGSGYAGHSMPGSVPFIEQVRQVVGSNNRVVILFGSLHDQGNPPDRLAPVVRRTLEEAKNKAPNATLLVIGPAWVHPDPPQGMFVARDVVKAEAEAMGVTFVDPLAEGWFLGQPELIDAKGNRPNNAGYRYMAEQIAPHILQRISAGP